MRYPPELKEHIVKLARAGRSVASLAREYDGPAESTIRKWVKRSRESEADAKVQTETEGVGTDPAPESGDDHPADLFSQTLQTDPETSEPPVAQRPMALSAPDSGVLATNDRNLMYMLAAGLLMPPSGFGGKHYLDTLSEFPGWLPLFIGPEGSAPNPPSAAVEDATGEADHLRPALVEVDLRELGGIVQAHGPDGWAERRLEAGVAAEESLLLFPAPLPVNRIRSVVFRSIEEQRAIEGDASDFGNVSFDGLDLKADQARFDSLSDQAWPLRDGPAERSVALAAAQAVGGVMAVLHRLANTGDLSLQTARCAFDRSFAPPDDPILRALPEWIATACGAGSESAPRTARALYWGAIDRVVKYRDRGGHDVADALVTFYRETAEGLDGELRTRAGAVVSTLESLGGGLGGDTVSRMLDRHRTPTGRAAILFLLRRKSRELFELMHDYPQLEERDRLAAGILFGARDGWRKFPLALRGSPEFANAVTHRMAVLTHRLDGSGCDLGTAPPRVRPLREIFGDPGGWGPAEEEAALRLANELDWRDCHRTTLSFDRGTYQLRIEDGAVHIDCADMPRVDTHLDRDRFFAHLAQGRINARLEADTRAQLERSESRPE